MLIIITEGKDEIFIREYLGSLGHEYKIDFATYSIGGWTNIKLSEPIIKRYIDEGNTVVLVFDADSDSTGGGHEQRLNDINSDLTDIDINIDSFLFPNDTDDGDFETLLERISVPDRNSVFNCFDAYEACVKALKTDELKFITPIRKSRIFAYIETFPETKKIKNKEIKDGTYFFKNTSYWDLNSDALIPLRDFLIPKL